MFFYLDCNGSMEAYEPEPEGFKEYLRSTEVCHALVHLDTVLQTPEWGLTSTGKNNNRDITEQ